MEQWRETKYIFLRLWKANLEAIFVRFMLEKYPYGRACDKGFEQFHGSVSR